MEARKFKHWLEPCVSVLLAGLLLLGLWQAYGPWLFGAGPAYVD
jgi:hypothetical protein